MGPEHSPAQWAERRAGDRRIFVSDSLFEPGLIGIVEKIVARLPLFRAEYDTNNSDIAHLKHEWPLDQIDAHPVLRGVRNVIAGAVDRLYAGYDPELRRVHLNDHPFGDLQGAHTDLSPGITAIFYVNSEWPDEWEGETLFYAGGEAVAAVAPRPGRVAIFGGDIVHRGGTPSRLCRRSRQTIAFKFKTFRIVP